MSQVALGEIAGREFIREACDAWRRGDFQLAERVMFQALSGAELSRTLPAPLIDAVHDLAGTYCVKRRYSDAARLYRRVLAAREKVLGESHPDLVDSLDRLAVVLCESDAKPDAMAARFRAMAIRSRAATA
ncbi:MAG: tetratricopeptide repeat protein [Candidatus Obscuribacterales bacterium]|nr:tetratricopeptide repeat protein [Candidatus Obscuribacterales bacterium]